MVHCKDKAFTTEDIDVLCELCGEKVFPRTWDASAGYELLTTGGAKSTL
jgi:hypothetical protein